MNHPAPAPAAAQPAIVRLTALAALDDASLEHLHDLVGRARLVPKRRELMREGRAVTEPQLIVSGWAARVRLLADGRRQFLGFLLPGDIIGLCRHPKPLAASTVAALTDVTVCTPPGTGVSPALDAAYALSEALDEAYLFAQITRLGRLNAQERIADMLLELNERLALNGMAHNGSFDLPLTQETLSDALGLTPVHVNRMLQTARQSGDFVWKSGRVTLADPLSLARRIGRAPVRVSAG